MLVKMKELNLLVNVEELTIVHPEHCDDRHSNEVKYLEFLLKDLMMDICKLIFD